MSIFKGVCTALITPFCNGNIDYVAMGNIIDFQIRNGVDALLVCGTTGEPSTMCNEEKLALVDFAVEKINGRVPLIVGIGGNCTADVIKFARQIEKSKVAGVLAVTPYYNKTTQNGLIEHYKAIADTVSVPIILYNVPTRTGVNILPTTILELSKAENIVAVKEASSNMAQITEILSLCKNNFDVYSGSDEINVPVFSVGGMGTISVLSNIMPSQVCNMTHLYFEGDVHTAAEIQKSLIPIIKCIFSEVNPIPIKAAANLVGLCKNELRLPLISISNANRAELVKCMKQFGLI